MAKATPAPTAYVVTSKSPLTYSGKKVAAGTIVTDIPGESITWLLEKGYIKLAPVQAAPSEMPAPEPAPEPAPTEPAPAEPATPADPPASA